MVSGTEERPVPKAHPCIGNTLGWACVGALPGATEPYL